MSNKRDKPGRRPGDRRPNTSERLRDELTTLALILESDRGEDTPADDDSATDHDAPDPRDERKPRKNHKP